MQHITVDFSKNNGVIKPMHAVNNGPAGSRTRGIKGNIDLYQAAGIPFARNHDASFFSGYGGEHTVDVHRIFKRFEADENDPASYQFESTDRYVQDTLSAGTQVFYRLGASIEHGQKQGTYPPADFAKWARICEHIIRHYNEGWANGFHYNITYWEIWNEPDCLNAATGHNPCWQGTMESFLDLFSVTLEHLKKCFPTLKIGGPALTRISDEKLDRQILSAVKEKALPLDFFSFHGYTTNPHKYADAAVMARRLLDEYGFTDTEIILNEWNYIRGWKGDLWNYSLETERNLKGSSFIVAAMCAAQASPMDLFMYYDARPCGMNGMFDIYTYKPLKGYYPFPMFNTLYQLGTFAQAQTDHESLYAVAATGAEGGALLLTHYDDRDDAAPLDVRIDFTGLPAGEVWQADYELLDGEHNKTLVRTEYFTAETFAAYMNLPVHSSYLIRFHRR